MTMTALSRNTPRVMGCILAASGSIVLAHKKKMAVCIVQSFLQVTSVVGFSTPQLPPRSHLMSASNVGITENQEEREVVTETETPTTQILRSKDFFSARSDDGKDVATLTSLINIAYAVGEKGIILDTKERPFQRMTLEETEQLVHQDKLLLLSVKNDEETEKEVEIIGCIKVDINNDTPTSGIDTTVGEWGCLAVNEAYQKKGYGTLLVQAAEQYFRSNSCVSMQLELLSPTTWKHPHKERLRSWYTSSSAGYRLKSENDYDASTTRFPEGSILGHRFVLLTDADFTVYTKPL